jgi:hypothetical protein
VYESETDGIVTQFPKNAQGNDKQSCLSMNVYLREREKVLFTIKHSDAMSSINFFLTQIQCKAKNLIKVILTFKDNHKNILFLCV